MSSKQEDKAELLKQGTSCLNLFYSFCTLA